MVETSAGDGRALRELRELLPFLQEKPQKTRARDGYSPSAATPRQRADAARRVRGDILLEAARQIQAGVDAFPQRLYDRPDVLCRYGWSLL